VCVAALHVQACVRERARKRERETECVCVLLRFMCRCVCSSERYGGGREREYVAAPLLQVYAREYIVYSCNVYYILSRVHLQKSI